ncbi:LysR family transcriptional regulator [Paraburkholderia agricolaris]|uniref:LysR family transcriptional regulator n=1 Tax=Paraburkholderia agricolaris TaxID=2152888 RepID=UPI0038B700D6
MDLLENLRALVLVAEHGSFSLAARELGLSASVVIKRVNAAEWQLRTEVFRRTTRRVTPTESGQTVIAKVQTLVHEFDELLAAMRNERIEPAGTGSLRVTIAPELAGLGLDEMLSAFLTRNAKLRMEVVWLERAVNPEAEGFDLAIDLQSLSYPRVTEMALMSLPFALVAAPALLGTAEHPTHPRDLQKHPILALESTGRRWAFRGLNRIVTVEVTPRFVTADACSVLDAAIDGQGIALLPHYLAQPALESGRLVRLLNDYPPVEACMMAKVPDAKASQPWVQNLLAWLALRLAGAPTRPA